MLHTKHEGSMYYGFRQVDLFMSKHVTSGAGVGHNLYKVRSGGRGDATYDISRPFQTRFFKVFNSNIFFPGVT